MKIRQMIKENNKLQEAMTPSNLKYYTEMVVYIRTSPVQEAKGEELLLEVAQGLLEAQAQGKSAEDVFGEDPEAYGQELIEQLPKMKGMHHLQYQIMIPWVALTWFFLVHAVIGFVAMWMGGPVERITRIPISTLILVAAISSILINLVMNGLKKESSQTDDDTKANVNIRGIAMYVAITVPITMGGIWLGQWLPVLVIHPGISLGIFGIGFIGTKLLFTRS